MSPTDGSQRAADGSRPAIGHPTYPPSTGAPPLALVEHGVASAATDRALTAREREVASLIATGATNRQIAAALQIAPKTASAHVEHILRKLGAARRTQIAAWAATTTPTD